MGGLGNSFKEINSYNRSYLWDYNVVYRGVETHLFSECII